MKKKTIKKNEVKKPDVLNYKQTELLSTYCDRRK